jgi:triosephosphate isomerase (TIM)
MGGGEVMKKIWIIANWKSNLSLSESLDWINAVGPKLNKREDLQVVVCPRFSALPELHQEIQTHNYPIVLGSQDLSPFGLGSFTGEEPADLLKELVTMSIIGHSERRSKFGETDEMVKTKCEVARKSGIEPILCVQDANTPIPEGIKITAYEPVFAIGTGTPDTPENAESVAKEIKSKNPELSILYGGSVTSENCESFIDQESISGLLIGKASLNSEEFLKIIQNCAKV